MILLVSVQYSRKATISHAALFKLFPCFYLFPLPYFLLVWSGDAPGSRRAERQIRRTNRSGERKAIAGICESSPAVLELTQDHRPDREEEKLRVEKSGGFVESRGGVPRVNGKLAVSRSIGDVAFKQ